MKAGVITFPGSNCDDDVRYALAKQAGFEVFPLWHKDSPDLSGFDLIALPGGFSYGDYLRCGAMASLSPIMDQVRKFAENGGYVVGICNGFQILCESQLLPGALARNRGLRFVCQDVSLRVENNESPWTSELKRGEVIQLPIAHGDGRYVIDEDGAANLERNGQVLLRYSAADGKSDETTNPNGSVHQIAGVTNERRNVFGLMPHPERASDLRSKHGLKILQSIARTLREKRA